MGNQNWGDIPKDQKWEDVNPKQTYKDLEDQDVDTSKPRDVIECWMDEDDNE
ncbi:hypothetical protein CHEID_10615 (plasmid) [Corynebacterium heidelbergense]|nr:hypothetical protein [Corynebacterium heidelbergense]WCZ36185.1 hypothetical protein CHEID_03125 [Corynebacterium heidelbergense]WCZ37640.1 hypothetical protein CHEID_10615 [Corynebacterium heidelbergense]